MNPRRLARLNAILDGRQTDLTVLLDDLQKAHNVSAVIRTCDAVGIGEVHAVTSDPSFKAKTTSAAGSEKFVRIRLHDSHKQAVAALHDAGYQIFAAHLSDDSIDFRSVDYTRSTCVLMGQEGPGVSDQLAAMVDGSISIPMVGAVESLNVSVAAAVILFEAQRQRSAAGMYQQPQMPAATRQHLLFEWGYKRLARYCREKGYAYPELDEQGQIVGPLPRG